MNENDSCDKDTSCTSCEDANSCADNVKQAHEEERLHQRLGRIRHKIMVMSGKGGVGKSTVAVNLAVALLMSGKQVGLLDVDIHGPSVPTMLGLEREMIHGQEGELLPIDVGGLKVLSLGFFLRSQHDAGSDRLSIEQYGTGTAFARLATMLDAEDGLPPQRGEQSLVDSDVERRLMTVECQV